MAPTPARAVHRGRGNAARILHVNGPARAAGVRPGRTLASARARCAHLVSVLEAPARMAEARRGVIRDLLLLTPRIAADGPARFWVEPMGGGDACLVWCAAVHRALADRGPVSVGIGPDATVAHAAAHAVHGGTLVIPEGEARRFLDDAPLEVLELDGEALDVLAALGIRRVGQLRALSPASLGMRFGPAVAEARRRAEGGDLRGPLTPRLEHEHRVRVELEDEIGKLTPLLFLLSPALTRLARGLSARGLGTLCLVLSLALRGGGRQVVEVRTSAPLADARPCLELLRTRLERERISAPVVAFELEASAVTAAPHGAGDLFGGPGRDPAIREVVLGRLRSRLGDGCVVRAGRVEVGPALARAAWNDGTALVGGPALPWRRLEPPARVERGRVRIAGHLRRVERVGAVERVTPPWWEDGRKRVELVAWAELTGPMVVLLRARCDSRCEDTWEVVAWVD